MPHAPPIAGRYGKRPQELLKQIAPGVPRAAVVRDPAVSSGSAQFGAIQAVSPFLGLNVSPVDAREVGDIERTMTAFMGSSLRIDCSRDNILTDCSWLGCKCPHAMAPLSAASGEPDDPYPSSLIVL